MYRPKAKIAISREQFDAYQDAYKRMAADADYRPYIYSDGNGGTCPGYAATGSCRLCAVIL